MRSGPQPKALTEAQHRYVLASLFAAGAASLVLEIVGTRVISPYYGSSLYCWSALITVTLVALAAGYNLGGRWADSAPSPTLFARLICFAGATIVFIPALRVPVLRATTPLGVQLGALTSASILVAPALILISALPPLAIRLTAQSLSGVGRASGDVYCVSTLGSVLGALLAGFALVPNLSVVHILYGEAALLLLLGALGYWLTRSSIALRPAVAAAAVAAFGFWPRVEPETNMIHSKESPYGQIKVLDFGERRYLLLNGTTQSMVNPRTGVSGSAYAQALEAAAVLRPGPRRAAVIGVGGGLLTGDLEKRYGWTVDSVDIDPDMIEAARRFFAFAPKGRVLLEDGRGFLERSAGAYAAVFLDAFGPEAPPSHLFTREAFEAARLALEPGGILAVNLVTLVNAPGDQAWRSTLKTLRTVFFHVRAFQPADTYDGLGNVVFFCSDRPLPIEDTLARARPEIRDTLKYVAAHPLEPALGELERAPLLTDDYAPLEFLLAKSSVQWRRMLQDKVEQVLLY